jgi:predicted LPLAT superfamily acyltransferase/uncharacterized protein (DUF2062 family)
MICRYAICIPVYNNPTTIVGVIVDTLKYTSEPVIVVDDGSDISVEEMFFKAFPGQQSRLQFVRHTHNQGKGIALQTAFRVAVEQGFTHLVTIDGDGQHDPQDISKLLKESLQNPWALIVGDRDMKTSNVPESSTFGKKFSNFWVKYQTNVGVSDSQSGYRLYPLFFVQNMKFYCKKYDFEIEVLIRLIWKGVKVKNVPVKVTYFPPETRVSHFNKLHDNIRITMLNTVLTAASLLRENSSPIRSAIAFGLGVFVGCTPLFGLHTLILAALAFSLRLNFLYLFIGSQVSLPPFLPLLLIGAHFLGRLALNHWTLTAASEAVGLILGSVIQGILLGIVGFIVVYWMKKKNKPETKKPWTGKNRNPMGILFVKGVLQTLGLHSTYLFLHLISLYYVFFSFRARKAFTEYWKVIHPEYGFWKRQIKIYKQINVFAQSLVDRSVQRMRSQNQGLYFDYDLDPSTEGFSEKVHKAQSGTVIIASHVGGWDMAISFFAQLSTGKKMMAVMYGVSNQYQHHSINQTGRAEIVHYNESENTIMRMRQHLTSGQVVTVMGDRPVSQSFELLPFFGKLALFDTTPIRLALACGSEIQYVFSMKKNTKRYRIYTYTSEKPGPHLSRDQQVIHYLKCYIRFLEKIVLEYPEQWFNFFPFWSEVSGEILSKTQGS